MEKLEVVSLIPARGGSIRIPRKNIKMLAGKPMMNWTIEASLKSKYIDRTFVSTEDEEIKEIALKAGAEVLDRPKEYGDEFNFYLNHFYESLWKMNYHPDVFIHLYATAPLRTAKHIDEAFELYMKSKADFLCSVRYLTKAIHHNRYIDERTGWLEYYYNFREWDKIKSFKVKHSDGLQLPKIYFPTGGIYIGPYPFDPGGAIYLNHVLPYIMKREDSIDVDTPFDFKVAEMLLKERIKGRDGK